MSSSDDDAVSQEKRLAPEAPRWSVGSSSLLRGGDRRFEARSYLADGYGLRQLIEARPESWRVLADLASIWQPPRLKGIVIPEAFGVPFLSAGQIFEARPRVRKWLARSQTPAIAERYVRKDWLLLSCSGSVGRVTAVYPHHHDVVITHDLLRVVPHDRVSYGWLYAYMKTPQFRAMAQAAEYGHMIKHLEVEHVASMPIVTPPREIMEQCSGLVANALDKRQRSLSLRDEAERRYGEFLSVPEDDAPSVETPNAVVSSAVLRQGRRRFDAAHFAPRVVAIEKLISDADTTSVDTVGLVCKSVSLGGRFRRYFGLRGTPYRSAEELFDLNAPITKRVYAGLIENAANYMLRSGWIVMARSGQVYGLNGQAILLGAAHDGIFGSDDLIRIVPDATTIAPGYLVTVLTHPTLGRPMVIRNAYGTSIPHLDPVDVRDIPIPRFGPARETVIADLATRAARLRDEADADENSAIELASATIGEIIHR